MHTFETFYDIFLRIQSIKYEYHMNVLGACKVVYIIYLIVSTSNFQTILSLYYWNNIKYVPYR